jgi:hypothetical protein
MNRRWPPLLLVPTMLLLFAGLGAAFHRGTALQPPPVNTSSFTWPWHQGCLHRQFPMPDII